MDQEKIKYSVVVPVFNEQDAVAEVHREIVEAMEALEGDYEVIFVNDGSTDGTLEILKTLKPIKIITLRRNWGQTAALDAGIKNARGEIIITLDGDGQNPPAEIPKLLKKMDQGFDMVSGWRYQRQDPTMKKIFSRGAKFLRKFLVDDKIHDSGCTLKVYKKECFEGLDLYGEMHRFIPAIIRWNGFEISEEKIEHRSRKTGQTKYNWKRTVKGFLDMWAVWFWRKYANRPLHLFGGLGLFLIISGSLMGLILIVLRILHLISLQRTIWSLFAIFLVLIGIQLFLTGILADILIKNYYKNGEKAYKIEKVIENK